VVPRDNRQLPRLKRRLPLRYSRDSKNWHTSFTQDIGPWGLFVVALKPLQNGVAVRIILDIGGEDLELSGRVAWRQPGAAALQRVQKGGFGVRIENAPERWYEFVASSVGLVDEAE
jgi:Tfp pilus assembly protein PilZ